jgi:hypothetical protein
LRRLCREHLPKIGQALAQIEDTTTPFQSQLRRKVQEYHQAHPDERERLIGEARYGRQLCRHYRSYWREVARLEEAALERAGRTDDMKDRLQQWRAHAARAIHESMKALAQKLSPEGLAYAVYLDWKQDVSASAGMALLTGRVGECLLPAGVPVEPLQRREQYRVVFRTGADLPIPYQGGTEPVERVRLLDSSENGPDLRVTVAGETIDLHVDGDEVPEEIPVYDVRLTRTARRSALLRWTRG